MNKKEYLSFHAKAIWKVAQSQNIDLLHSIYSPSDKMIDAQKANYLLNCELKITSESELCKLLYSKKILPTNSMVSSFLKEILIKANENELNYFIKHSSDLMTTVSLDNFLNIIKDLPFEKVTIFNRLGEYIKEFDIELIEPLIKSILKLPHSDNILANYLVQNQKYFDLEFQKNIIQDLILTYYPNHLESFKKINVINEYITNRDEPIFYEHIQETIYICLNLKTIRNQFTIPNWQLSDYERAIVNLINALTDKKFHLNIFNIDIKEFSNGLNIYINFEENSLILTKQTIEQMVIDFISFFPKTSSHYFDISRKDLEELQYKFINSALLNNKLNKELFINKNPVIKRKNKI